MNGINFSSSSLLCGHGNTLPSKEPKYTLNSGSDHPYEPTYALSKHIPETDVNQTRSCVLFLYVYSYKVTQVFKCFSGDSEMFLSNKINPWTCYQVSKPVLWTRPNPSSSSQLSVLLIHMGHNHQQQHLPVSPPNSKFFLHNVKVIKFEKQSSLTLQ